MAHSKFYSAIILRVVTLDNLHMVHRKDMFKCFNLSCNCKLSICLCKPLLFKYQLESIVVLFYVMLQFVRRLFQLFFQDNPYEVCLQPKIYQNLQEMLNAKGIYPVEKVCKKMARINLFGVNYLGIFVFCFFLFF